MDSSTQDGPSLLLVEDNGLILDSLRGWLKARFPYVRLIETKDHRSGVSLNRSRSPDAVLMDISNLGRDGVESVRTMKTAQPAAAVFVLVSLDHEAYCQAVLQAGAEACACAWEFCTDMLPKLEEHLPTERDNGPAHHRLD